MNRAFESSAGYREISRRSGQAAEADSDISPYLESTVCGRSDNLFALARFERRANLQNDVEFQQARSSFP